jgi:uncharacterized protein
MLFGKSELMGTFKGFVDQGLEFAAEIVAPYDSSMLDRPQLGQLLLIELGSKEEAALGRITRFVPTGLLASAEGEDYVNTMQARSQDVPEELKKQRLKYRVQIKLLGAVREIAGKIIYVPSQRRLPHLGARVANPSAEVLQALCSLNLGSTDLGYYVLGEFVFCGEGKPQVDLALRSVDPELRVKFDVQNLVARRTVVFARAGYGKSNLIKFLLSELYRTPPKTADGKPVGTLIFDAEGEYFWPDNQGRPGLCDVPHLKDQLLVFTNRKARSPYYGSWKVGEVRLDVRSLPARDVVDIVVPGEKQLNQNVLKLKGLGPTRWSELVDLVYAKGLQADEGKIAEILGYKPEDAEKKGAEIGAALSNVNNIVQSLHDPESQVIQGTIDALLKGWIVVIDISLVSNAVGTMIAGLLLRRLFAFNQANFTSEKPYVSALAVIEEAQSVLGRSLEGTSPFVEWVKEGRKYQLGAVLVTQQPGSLASDILSQADNWFSFHLLSEGDAATLGKYNAHFSDDILAHLIAEPIRGNCYMWSAPLQPFVLPVRLRNFEELYKGSTVMSSTAPEVQAAAAAEVKHELHEAISVIADKMRAALRAKNVKFVALPPAKPGGEALTGVYGGQLFYLLQAAKPPNETRSEEELKLPVMSAILGEGNLQIVEHGEKRYFAATSDAWKAGIGLIPTPNPP